jgi:DNA-binding response OmpR family regulator
MPAPASRVLVVEDEESLAEGIRFNLEAEGCAVEVIGDGALALARLQRANGDTDLVIMDVMLPGVDGFEIVERMRKAGNFTPVLMLTAKSLPEDVVHGLERGADDYLPKPFDLKVLLARVKGLLRRRDWARGATEGPEVAKIGDAQVDFRSFEIRSPGKTVVKLTLLEAMLLKLLAQQAGRIVSKAEILEKVWNVSPESETRAVDNFIARLRKYLEPDPAKPRYLLTVRGAGWRLVLE